MTNMNEIRKYLLCLGLFVSGLGYAQIININNAADAQSTLSMQQLVTDVLINSDCAVIDNFSEQVSGQPADTQSKSYGYFSRPAGSDFPFEEGVVLTTGIAFAAGNTVDNGSPFPDFTNGLPGDADLQAALGIGNTNDATFVSFNFVPTSDDFNFRFLMASEEYDGNTECQFADGFAFLLREVGTTAYTNLAVLPNGQPVSVRNINNSTICAANTEFFEGYNLGSTNYGGRTVVLTATADVIPNQAYEIKIVVADQGDSAWDSAIFLEAGSFNIGLDLGADFTVAGGNAACSDDPLILDTLIPTTIASHTWFLDGVEIPGETETTLNVVTDGTYTVVVEYASNCTSTDDVTIEFAQSPIANPIDDALICDDDNDGFWTFDFMSFNPIILGSQVASDFFVSYHSSQDGANTNTDFLPLIYTNTVAYQQEEIFVRIQNNDSRFCFDTTSFLINVFDPPTTANITYEECDNNSDGDSTNGFLEFDLNALEAQVLGGLNPVQFNISYHLNQNDADMDQNALPLNYTNTNANNQNIIVRLENVDNEACYVTAVVSLIVNPLPQLQNTTLVQCDEDGNPDGFTEYNLNEANQNIMVSGNTSGFTYTHYLSLVDAQSENNSQVPFPFINTVNPQTIYIRVVDDASGCISIGEVVLDVTATDIGNADLDTCDDDYDGIAFFDLTEADATILQNLPVGLTVAYYATANDAQLEINQLPDAYQNTTPFNQMIFVRVENANECFGINTMNLTVNPLPEDNVVTDTIFCSGDAAGALVDLTQFDAQILGGQNAADIDISYYESQVDADAGTNSLPNPYLTSFGLQTIFTRVENTVTNCFISNISFDITVNPLPQLVAPTPLEVCDDGVPDGLTDIDLSLKITEITGNNPNYTVSYYETIAEAETQTNTLPLLYTNISNPQIIFVRVEDTTTGCSDTTELELVVQQAPIANTPQPLRYCDPDNDGNGIFTLTDVEAEITGGAAGLSVTYHETQINAENGVDAIDTSIAYANIVQDMQTLYVRVESATIATDCATIVVLELIVEDTPQLTAPSPLEVCDDISADGFAVFDLTTKTDEVLNGQDATPFNFTYYQSEANAEAAMNPIANPLAYTNTVAFNQTIWIRVEDTTTVSGCFKLISLELIVNPLPVLITPPPLELCDVTDPAAEDGQEAFTLEDANAAILNGQTGITLTHYETQFDADNATDPITSPYVNTMNAQTIFVRAENDITGCYNTVTVTLRVNPIPSPEPDPEPIEVCDDDNDGYAEFDLEQRTIAITNGETDIVITYHETETEAEVGENPITGLYMNIVPNNQFIYVRSENTLTGCFSLTQNRLELIVNPAPEVPSTLAPYTICDMNDDGQAQFDLTTKDDEVLNGQDPTQVILTYHTSAADAQTGNNPIINVGNYTNSSNPQLIYVRLFDPVTTCFDTGVFELIVALPPEAVQPTQLNQCDDLGEVPGNEITVFDLTVKDAEITAGNASWSVDYYETLAEAQAQTNVIPDPTQYTNTGINGALPNPQTLHAVVTDTNTGCISFVTLTIRVLPNPTPTASALLPNIELCDDNGAGDAIEVFDLTENQVLIRNGEVGVTITYYESLEDADAGSSAIADPTQYSNMETPQEIYVRMTNDLTGCYELVDFTIIVHPLPEVVAVTDFIQCELNTDGQDSFDLTIKDAEVLNGQDATLFAVSYHESLADAEAGINDLVSPYSNTLGNPQQIFVTITNTETGCSISTQSFNIEVQEAAQANPDMDPILYELCDDAMETDGNATNDSTQFDLTAQNADILDGQDPVNYIVSYYESQDDADNKVNPLPTLYENITNPQVIYARVDNDTLDGMGADTSICYETAELTLQVNALPLLQLEELYILCVNTDGSEIREPLVIDTGLSASDYSFVWTLDGTEITGETGSSIMPSQGGTYTVTVTDETTSLETNCSNDATMIVEESERPTLTINLLTDAFADNHILEAVVAEEGDFEYSLDGGLWQDDPIFTNVSPGLHEITARDKNGCGLDTATKFIIDYPLFFTPNGDAQNETWNIEGIGNDAKIYIFDRYGKLLKQLSPTGTGWDGTFNGSMMPTSDYWFTVEYTEPGTTE
ncbi:MAG: choice-of-anchor L domain-containing protein, partial [Winogradskyella sp.]|uniref:choice-of-anchor L domain-containing protein n=1 Tax=Winogradskyella sp. TaxID=1883156 RepID=UPI003859D3A0